MTVPELAPTRTLRFTGPASAAVFAHAVAEVGHWYHSFYFDNGYELRGDYDIGRDIDAYGFPTDLKGLRVLDVGAASGWFSFYFEQLGAQVTSYDLRSHAEMDRFGRYEPVTELAEPAEWVKGADVMAGLLGSRVRRVHGRVYDLPFLLAGERFDLVFMGALLLHLRDPIGALLAARRVCAGRLIATNWFMSSPDGQPAAGFPACDLPALSPEYADGCAWWRPNRSAYELWFRAAGFRTVDANRTVNLTADVVVPEHANSTQTLLVADARV